MGWLMFGLIASTHPASGTTCRVTPDGNFEMRWSGPKSKEARNWWSDAERAKTGRLFARDESSPYIRWTPKGGL